MASSRDLPKDVMIQIILHLPVKSIVRFRSLSKYWYALLKSESFINTHLLSTCRKTVLLVRRCLLPPHKQKHVDNFDVLSFHDPDSPELNEVSQTLSISPYFKDFKCPKYGNFYPSVKLLGPCDGIICIYMFRADYIILANPALHEFKRIPKCPFACPQGCYFRIEGIGFGRSRTSTSTSKEDDDFKVVMLTNADPDDEHSPNVHIMVNVYSLGTNSWKQIDANGIVSYINVIKSTQQLFFNGACHWLAIAPILDDDYTIREQAILCFDLSTEVVRYLEYPPTVNGEYYWENIMIFDECVTAVGRHYHISEGYSKEIDIWVMKEYGVRESWIKQFVIIGYSFPFLPWKNEWVLMEVSDQLVSYSFRTNQVKRYQFYGQEGTLGALIYQESLISLKQI